jgi:hypothetical protein
MSDCKGAINKANHTIQTPRPWIVTILKKEIQTYYLLYTKFQDSEKYAMSIALAIILYKKIKLQYSTVRKQTENSYVWCRWKWKYARLNNNYTRQNRRKYTQHQNIYTYITVTNTRCAYIYIYIYTHKTKQKEIHTAPKYIYTYITVTNTRCAYIYIYIHFRINIKP